MDFTRVYVFSAILWCLGYALSSKVDCATWKVLGYGDEDATKFTKIAAASSSTLLYTFGGEFEGQYNGDLKSFDPLKKRWSTLPVGGSIPSRRAGATLTKIATGLYLIGGHNEHGTLGSIHKYDLINNKWQHVLMPEDSPFISRSGHSACTDGRNRIFVFGGYNDDGLFLNDLYEISISSISEPESGTTNLIASVKLLSKANDKKAISPPPREYGTMHVIDGKLYLYGGYGYGGSVKDGMWTFDLGTSVWKLLNSELAPTPSEGFSSITMGRSIFFFGGCDFSYISSRCYSDLWKYDTTSSKWSIIPTSSEVKPTGRAFSAMAFLHGGIILHGGSKLDKKVLAETYHLVELLPCKDPKHTCLSRGKCYQSYCECDKGFEGHDCGIEVVPENLNKHPEGTLHTEM